MREVFTVSKFLDMVQ